MIYLNDSSHDSHFPILHQGIVFACKEFKEVSVMAVFFCLFDLRGRYRKQPIIQDRSSVSMIPSNTLEAVFKTGVGEDTASEYHLDGRIIFAVTAGSSSGSGSA